MAGDSAGGGLTALLCHRIRDAGEPAPVLQILVYPMLSGRMGRTGYEGIQGQLVWTPAADRSTTPCPSMRSRRPTTSPSLGP